MKPAKTPLNKSLALVLAGTLALSPAAFAAQEMSPEQQAAKEAKRKASTGNSFYNSQGIELSDDAIELGGIKLRGGIDVNVDTVFKKGKKDDLKDNVSIRETELKASAELAKGLELYIAAEINQAITEDGEDGMNTQSLDEFIESAAMRVNLNEHGVPVAFVFGKINANLGPRMSRLIERENPLDETGLNRVERRAGIAIELDTKNFFALLDKISVAGYNSEKDTFDLGTIDGVAVSLQKTLGHKDLPALLGTEDSLTAVASFMYQENEYLGDGHNESRQKFDFIYQKNNGDFEAFGTVIAMQDHPELPEDSTLALRGGVSKKLMDGISVTVDATWIEESQTQIAAGLNVRLNQNFSVIPMIAHNWFEDESRKDGLLVGVRVRSEFGGVTEKRPGDQSVIGGGSSS